MMKRSIPTFVGLAIALSFSATETRAQFGYGMYPGGYGGYGWGGWGGGGGQSYAGSVAQGLGMFNIGAGIYNEKTAVANSINTDTTMRWNQYVYEAQKEATRQYYGRRDANIAKNKEAFNSQMDRINNNPSARDVERGDALNAILDQLSDPRIPPSALRTVDAPIDAKLVRQIPFVSASEAISISLEAIRDASKWPARLRDPRLEPEQKDFEKLVVQARKEDEEGEIAPETLTQLRGVAKRIKDKVSEMPLANRREDIDAMNFAKTIVAMTRLLDKPQVEQVLDELRKIDKTNLSNVLGFMHTFNLRFGPATTPDQRTAYSELFPAMDGVRDKLLAELKLPETTPSYKAQPHDFFSAMGDDDIEGKKKAAPAPAAGATPPPPTPKP
ncbi:hypothetical protein [Paludisphaera mucosa]|uniref:Uncharacterized protein n=1 Tax=Paludisphaera mucosa TaxID=3030827 RepID=A0ABT6F6V4_9BACT|nr:hypothetical protein [Paludisphaera mucosa]MDG3003312.1 hypothetical protein [Paludisphaera mucosa]